MKSVFPNAFNAVWYGYAGKAGATFKSLITNDGNAVVYGYAGKVGTTVKSANRYAGNAIGYMFMLARLVQSKKALLSMLVTLAGRVTPVRLPHFSKEP
jgi:hypothetical protein